MPNTYTDGNGLDRCGNCHELAYCCHCPCPHCDRAKDRCICGGKAPIVAFIEARTIDLAPADATAVRGVVACILGYEQSLDGEYGCCHQADEIAAGRCSPPSNILALRIIAARWFGHPDFDAAWNPEED